jgi:hypothetical protein
VKGIGIRLAIIAVIALGGFLLRDRLSGNAGDLQVGDCFDAPTTEGIDVGDVPHHPCTEGHTAEVILVKDYDGADTTYPTDDAWLGFVSGNCVPAFNAYTGIDYETDVVFEMGYFTPNLEGWDGGDREVSCYAIRIDRAPMNASIKRIE